MANPRTGMSRGLCFFFCRTKVRKNYTSERKTLGILKFFKGVYGGDKFTKPHKQSFLNATGEYKIDECAMIGDNINVDIIGAKNSGIKRVVWKDNKNIASEYKDKLSGVDVIKNLENLKDIF